MTAKEYNRLREALGFSQEAMGVWLGFSPRQGQRFALGEREIPKSVAMLLRVMVKHHITIAEAEKGT
jgi:hypothetical protein